MPAARVAFSGELGVVGLFDLGQLLLLNRATGVLVADGDGGRGYLYFRDGRIVSALDDEHRDGAEAAYRVFTWTRGRFEFREEAVAVAVSIEEGTEALMLEAARRMDEAAEAAGESGAGMAERLAGRGDAMAALREAFSSVAREARSVATKDAGGADGAMAALARADDRLVLRPGRPARLRLGGAWREARDAALTAAEYEELRARLLGPAAAESRVAFAALPGGRRVRVERIAERDGEALWVRPADLAPPVANRLLAAPDEMESLHAFRRGLALIGGDDPDAAARVLHALIADRLARHPGLVLLAGSAGVYRHAEGAGLLVEVEPRGVAETVAALGPDALALETPVPPAGAFATLAGVEWVLALAPAGDGAAAFEAWLAALLPADRTRFEAWLDAEPVLWIRALAAGGAAETLPVEVRPLDRSGEARPSEGPRAGVPRASESRPGPPARRAA